MKIACLFDIHGNYSALKAVMDDLKRYNIDKIIIGGDFLSGPMPSETLKELLKYKGNLIFLRGNGEEDILNKLNNKSLNYLSKEAREVTEWITQKLDKKVKSFLEELPIIIKIKHDILGEISFCHATPDSTVKIFTSRTSENILKEIFEKIDSKYLICGHTHLQFKLIVNKIEIYNSGSVGMSFGDHLGADWILISDNEIKYMTTQYDYNKCKELFLKTKYPNINKFIENNILKIHNEDEVLNYLEGLNLEKSK